MEDSTKKLLLAGVVLAAALLPSLNSSAKQLQEVKDKLDRDAKETREMAAKIGITPESTDTNPFLLDSVFLGIKEVALATWDFWKDNETILSFAVSAFFGAEAVIGVQVADMFVSALFEGTDISKEAQEALVAILLEKLTGKKTSGAPAVSVEGRNIKWGSQ